MLTQILRPALGGNCATVVLAVIVETTCPTDPPHRATASTLSFTGRMRSISCSPSVNVVTRRTDASAAGGGEHGVAQSWMRRENDGVRSELVSAQVRSLSASAVHVRRPALLPHHSCAALCWWRAASWCCAWLQVRVAALERALGARSAAEAKVWELAREVSGLRAAAAAERERGNALEADLAAAKCDADAAVAAAAAADERAEREASAVAAERRAAAGATARAAAMEGAVDRMARQLANATGMSEKRSGAAVAAAAVGRLFSARSFGGGDDVAPPRTATGTPAPLSPSPSNPALGRLPSLSPSTSMRVGTANDEPQAPQSPMAMAATPTAAASGTPRAGAAAHGEIAKLRQTLDASLHVAAQQHSVRHAQADRDATQDTDPGNPSGSPVDAGAVTRMLNLLLQVAKAATAGHDAYADEATVATGPATPEPAPEAVAAVTSVIDNPLATAFDDPPEIPESECISAKPRSMADGLSDGGSSFGRLSSSGASGHSGGRRAARKAAISAGGASPASSTSLPREFLTKKLSKVRPSSICQLVTGFGRVDCCRWCSRLPQVLTRGSTCAEGQEGAIDGAAAGAAAAAADVQCAVVAAAPRPGASGGAPSWCCRLRRAGPDPHPRHLLLQRLPDRGRRLVHPCGRRAAAGARSDGLRCRRRRGLADGTAASCRCPWRDGGRTAARASAAAPGSAAQWRLCGPRPCARFGRRAAGLGAADKLWRRQREWLGGRRGDVGEPCVHG